MSLSFGHSFLSIPGPSAMPDSVLREMHRPSPNIYEGELVDMMPELMADLKRVARTDAHAAIYISNGHGAWEAALANCFSRGDKVLLIATGRFGPGWGAMAEAMGIEVETLDFGGRSPADADALEARLRADTKHRFKAVLTVHTDTASSVRNDIVALRAAIDAAQHPALFLVDCIANLGCEQMEMDAWGVDVVVTGAQKGLMTPAGIAFVFFSDKARAASDKADLKTNYWDWSARAEPQIFYQRFCGTAPTHHLYGLRRALTLLLEEEGLESAWKRHEILARAVWAAGAVWAEAGSVTFNITDPQHRSNAVTTFRVVDNRGTELRRWCQDFVGLTLGMGLGVDPGEIHSDGLFRIGHMGHLTPHALLGTLSVVDAGLKALDIPHGNNAITAAIEVIAEAGRA